MNFINHKNEPQNKTNLFTISIQSHLLHEYNPPPVDPPFLPRKSQIPPTDFDQKFSDAFYRAKAVCDAIRAKQSRFMLQGDEINLNPQAVGWWCFTKRGGGFFCTYKGHEIAHKLGGINTIVKW